MKESKSYSEQHKVQPNLRWVYKSIPRILAFGFGSGLIKPAPGTWGTLAGWLLWLIGVQFVPNAVMPLVLVLAFVLGCFICSQVGRQLGQTDHGGIVIDEIVAIWIVLWLSPASWLGQLVAFTLFRFFDILKPPPISYFDKNVPNGFGVMLDDLLAAIYSVLVMLLLVYLGWVS